MEMTLSVLRERGELTGFGVADVADSSGGFRGNANCHVALGLHLLWAEDTVR